MMHPSTAPITVVLMFVSLSMNISVGASKSSDLIETHLISEVVGSYLADTQQL